MAVHKRGGDDCEVAGRTVMEEKSEKSNGLSEEWRTKSEESNGLSEEWKVKSEKSNGLSEKWKVKSEKSNGLSEDTQATSVGQSPTKPHVLVLLNQAFTLPSCSHVLLS